MMESLSDCQMDSLWTVRWPILLAGPHLCISCEAADPRHRHAWKLSSDGTKATSAASSTRAFASKSDCERLSSQLRELPSAFEHTFTDSTFFHDMQTARGSVEARSGTGAVGKDLCPASGRPKWSLVARKQYRGETT